MSCAPALRNVCLLAVGGLLCTMAVGCGGSDLPPPRATEPDEPTAVVAPPPSAIASPAVAAQLGNAATDTNTNDAAPEVVDVDPSVAGAQRKQRDLANLPRVVAALLNYVNDHDGQFPAHRGLLSWRVDLLPYLGQRPLHSQFNFRESYHREPNAALAANIPRVYSSTDPNPDGRTHYLGIFGTNTFFGDDRGATVEQVTDGLENTILLLVVTSSVKWTQPTNVSLERIENYQLDDYAGDAFLAVMGDGKIVEVDRRIPASVMRGACTIAGREPVEEFRYYIRPATLLAGAPAPPLVNRPVEEEVVTSGRQPARATGGEFQSIDRSLPKATSPGATRAIPSDADQKRAMALVKEMFLDRYQQATNDTDKRKIGREMLAKSSQLGDDLAGKYAMLTTTQRVALTVDDIETADKALDALVKSFDVDAYAMKVALLKKTASLSRQSSFDTRVMDQSWEMVEQAIKRDDYATAHEMAAAALAAARRLNDKQQIARISRGAAALDKMEASYRRVKQLLAEVGNAAPDAAASETIGRYFCFTKGQWEVGLPHLSRAEDADIRRFAQRDLESPVDARQQLELADGWWQLSQHVRSPEDVHLQQRALFWYEAALKDLPKGLPRLKAELRVKEIRAAG